MGRSAGIGLPAIASMMAGSTSSSASLSEAYEISDASSPSSESRCYGARTSRRSPWGGDTARRRFIGGGRGPLLS